MKIKVQNLINKCIDIEGTPILALQTREVNVKTKDYIQNLLDRGIIVIVEEEEESATKEKRKETSKELKGE